MSRLLSLRIDNVTLVGSRRERAATGLLLLGLGQGLLQEKRISRTKDLVQLLHFGIFFGLVLLELLGRLLLLRSGLATLLADLLLELLVGLLALFLIFLCLGCLLRLDGFLLGRVEVKKRRIIRT